MRMGSDIDGQNVSDRTGASPKTQSSVAPRHPYVDE